MDDVAPIETPHAAFQRLTRSMVEAGMGDIPRRERVDHLLAIQGLARLGDYAPIDEVLHNVPPARLSDRSIMQMLRGTFMFRSRLVWWNAFRDDAGDAYADRDMPAADLMYGLGWHDCRTRFGALTRSMMAAGMDDVSSDDRVDHIVTIQRLGEAGEYRTLDMMLFEAVPESLSEMSLIHLLRSTYLFRKGMPSWPGFRDRVGDTLEHRGRPAAKILTGLDWRPLSERDPEMHAAREASRARRAETRFEGSSP